MRLTWHITTFLKHRNVSVPPLFSKIFMLVATSYNHYVINLMIVIECFTHIRRIRNDKFIWFSILQQEYLSNVNYVIEYS